MNSKIDRRTFIASLPGLAVVPAILTRMKRRALSALGLNHAVLSVSDPERSVAFYQELLGMPIQARQGRTTILRIGDGPQHLAIRPVETGQAPEITRMGIAVADFDVDGAIEMLAEAGVRFSGITPPADPSMRAWVASRGSEEGGRAQGTRELFIGDPHGIVVQVVDRSHCGGGGLLGGACGSIEPAPRAGRIAVRDLNHFTSNVPDPDRANEFYGEAFGMFAQVYQAAAAALDADSGGTQFLMFTGGGAPDPSRRGTINHLCMTTEGFDTEAILATLADFGIRPRTEGEPATVPFIFYISMRMPNRGGAPGGTPELYFTDPDGLRIQLQDTTYCGGGGYLGSVC